MLLARLHKAFTAPAPNALTAKTGVWLGLSLAIAITFALAALQDAFSGQRIVQDDARQFLFWMQRFQDAELFPNDLIADYFQSVTPLGYTALYRLGIAFGLDPFTFNKCLPIGLGLITTGYFFWLAMALIPIPFTSFMACLLLNQTLWMKDDLVSATPRSFVYPFFIAFLYYLIRPSNRPQPNLDGRSLALGCGAIALLGLFYPQYVLIAGGVVLLSFLCWRQGRIQLVQDRATWIRGAVYLSLMGLIVAFYGLSASDFGPVVTADQARAMPEFWPGGRSFFFSENLWWFYGVGDRSGFLLVGLVRPATLCLGLALPVLVGWSRYSGTFAIHPILKRLTPQSGVLIRLLLSATGLFVLAHGLLFRLHLPSRYTDHSLRIVMAIAAAIVLTLILDALLRVAIAQSTPTPSPSTPSPSTLSPSTPSPPTKRGVLLKGLALGGAAILSSAVLLYPAFVEDFPLTKYKQGTAPDLYAFFQAQPKDIQVASVAEEVNNIPIFAQRSILVGREYAIPYHIGYYRSFQARAVDLIQAQYSPDAANVREFIHTYGVDYWIVDTKAYETDYLIQNWTRQYLPRLSEDIQSPLGWSNSVLRSLQAPCTVLTEGPLLVLDTACVLDALEPQSPSRS